jgi:hypothetical protein
MRRVVCNPVACFAIVNPGCLAVVSPETRLAMVNPTCLVVAMPGAFLAMRSAVTIFVEDVTGPLLDLGAVALLDVWEAVLVMDFFDTGMVNPRFP